MRRVRFVPREEIVEPPFGIGELARDVESRRAKTRGTDAYEQGLDRLGPAGQIVEAGGDEVAAGQRREGFRDAHAVNLVSSRERKLPHGARRPAELEEDAAFEEIVHARAGERVPDEGRLAGLPRAQEGMGLPGQQGRQVERSSEVGNSRRLHRHMP